jgi:hypothetical protein
MPRGGVLDVGHPLVDVAHERGALEGRPDERIHIACGVVLAHPVVAVREDAKPGERIDERLRVVARVRGVKFVDLIRHMSERPAHLVLDGVGRQERLCIHRVEVIDSVEQCRLDAVRAKRARDRIEDHGAAQASDVDGTRGRLRVVDDLRARVTDPLRELVRPVHAVS